MDCEGSSKIPVNTRTRALEPIIKDGYKEGAADGQSSVFQTSFDSGYEQGLSFGRELGKADAYNGSERLLDVRSLNCQICSANKVPQQNIVNLINNQKEKNDDYLNKVIYKKK